MDLFDSSFVAVRVGDVDNSWGTGDISYSDEILTDTTHLDLGSTAGYIGDTVSLDLAVYGFSGAAGIEFHIYIPGDDLALVSVVSDVLSDITFNSTTNAVHIIWEDIDNPVTLPDGDILLKLEFEILTGEPSSLTVDFMEAYIVDVEGNNFVVFGFEGEVVRLLTSIDDDDEIPVSFDLGANYPNPFNGSTIINYQLPQSSHIQIVIYDVLGRTIDTILDETKEAGYHQVTWNSPNQPSGIYFYRMITDEFSKTSKMLYLK
jgi:hypothetical protein